MRYAVIYDDENMITTGYHDTPEGAIKEWEDNASEKWSEDNDYSVQGFTSDEIIKIEAYSEEHPQ